MKLFICKYQYETTRNIKIVISIRQSEFFSILDFSIENEGKEEKEVEEKEN